MFVLIHQIQHKMKTKSFLFLIFLLVSLQASAQFNLLSNEKNCNEIIPKFCAEFNIADSTKATLLQISLKYIEEHDAMSKKYFGDNPAPQVAPGSPFFVESRDLMANRDTQIEKLLGKKTSKDFAMYLVDYISKKAKEMHKEKK